MADAPRSLLRTNFPPRVHWSSKSPFSLTSCPDSDAQNSRICHRLPFHPEIRDFRGADLTF